MHGSMSYAATMTLTQRGESPEMATSIQSKSLSNTMGQDNITYTGMKLCTLLTQRLYTAFGGSAYVARRMFADSSENGYRAFDVQ